MSHRSSRQVPFLGHYFVSLVRESSALKLLKVFYSWRRSLVTERLGRKWTLQVNVLVFVVGAIMMTVAKNQLGLICEDR